MSDPEGVRPTATPDYLDDPEERPTPAGSRPRLPDELNPGLLNTALLELVGDRSHDEPLDPGDAEVAMLQARANGWDDLPDRLKVRCRQSIGRRVDPDHLRVVLGGVDFKTKTWRLPVAEQGDAAGEGHQFTVYRAGDVPPQPVAWEWRGRVERGETTLLAGDGDEGKGFIGAGIVAALSKGVRLPGDGAGPRPARACAWVTGPGEDSPARLRERFEAAGVDMDTAIINAEAMPGAMLAAVKYAVTERAAQFVLVDSVALFAGADGVQTSDAGEVRKWMTSIRAAAGSATVMLIAHWNKNEDGASLQHRAAGSHQFSAAARGVLSVRGGVITVSKLNNGTKALPLEFEIVNTASNVGAAAWGSTVVGGGPDDDNGGGGGVSDDRAEQAVLSALKGSTEGEPVLMSDLRETVQGRRKFNGRQWSPYRAAVDRLFAKRYIGSTSDPSERRQGRPVRMWISELRVDPNPKTLSATGDGPRKVGRGVAPTLSGPTVEVAKMGQVVDGPWSGAAARSRFKLTEAEVEKLTMDAIKAAGESADRAGVTDAPVCVYAPDELAGMVRRALDGAGLTETPAANAAGAGA